MKSTKVQTLGVSYLESYRMYIQLCDDLTSSKKILLEQTGQDIFLS